jgi:hypothetical protein
MQKALTQKALLTNDVVTLSHGAGKPYSTTFISEIEGFATP